MAENDGYKIHITDIYLDEIEKVGANVVSFSIKQGANVLTNMYTSSFSHNFNKCKLSDLNIYLILIFIEWFTVKLISFFYVIKMWNVKLWI